jgi:hypothetical protein
MLLTKGPTEDTDGAFQPLTGGRQLPQLVKGNSEAGQSVGDLGMVGSVGRLLEEEGVLELIAGGRQLA